MPGAVKPGTLKLGLLKLGKLKLGKLGSAPQPDRAALLSIEAIVRRIITISQGPIAQDDSQKKGFANSTWPLGPHSAKRRPTRAANFSG
jgi:hypothetical protein